MKVEKNWKTKNNGAIEENKLDKKEKNLIWATQFKSLVKLNNLKKRGYA